MQLSSLPPLFPSAKDFDPDFPPPSHALRIQTITTHLCSNVEKAAFNSHQLENLKPRLRLREPLLPVRSIHLDSRLISSTLAQHPQFTDFFDSRGFQP